MRPPRVTSVEVLHGFTVRLRFTDGEERVIDLDRHLRGPVFEPLRADPALFRAVRVDADAGTVVWPNGADICPDVLHDGLAPASWGESA